jgi:hypothetical protein
MALESQRLASSQSKLPSPEGMIAAQRPILIIHDYGEEIAGSPEGRRGSNSTVVLDQRDGSLPLIATARAAKRYGSESWHTNPQTIYEGNLTCEGGSVQISFRTNNRDRNSNFEIDNFEGSAWEMIEAGYAIVPLWSKP